MGRLDGWTITLFAWAVVAKMASAATAPRRLRCDALVFLEGYMAASCLAKKLLCAAKLVEDGMRVMLGKGNLQWCILKYLLRTAAEVEVHVVKSLL